MPLPFASTTRTWRQGGGAHLAGFVVAEERVPVDVEEVALVGVRQAGGGARHVLRRVQAQQLVQPGLHLVTRRVPAGWLPGLSAS